MAKVIQARAAGPVAMKRVVAARPAGRARPQALAAGAPQFFRIARMRHVPGFLHGLRAPSVEARIEVTPWSGWLDLANHALTLLEERLPGMDVPGSCAEDPRPAPAAPSPASGSMARLARVLQRLQDAAGMPFLGEPCLIAEPAADKSRSAVQMESWVIAVPSLSPTAVAEALVWVVQWSNRRGPESQTFTSQDEAELTALLGRMGRSAARGFNNRYLIAAAHQRGIPWSALPGGIYQYGWGSLGVWMESTFTQSTASLSSKAARNKAVAAELLRQAGLPAPAHRIVQTEAAAIEAAAALGYPIVVKPLDRDGGVGVSAGLRSEAELRSAFARARAHADNLLVEKHVEGRDYRVYVYRGKAVGAMERVPGGVTGDGAKSVAELVAATNLDPRRGKDDWSILATLVLDDEALELMATVGLDAQSVPQAGQFVRLRRAANVSTGGTPVDVLAQMHPDNARLCERAARALRLDLAGIDLLMPDITRSWHETGAGICEVNAQPRLSRVATAHLFPAVLAGQVRGSGRIPSAMVLGGAGAAQELLRKGAQLLARRGIRPGTCRAEGVYAGTQRLAEKGPSLLTDVRTLATDQDVDAILLHAEGRDLAITGMPLDRFDVLVVAELDGPAKGADTVQAQATLMDSLKRAAPHCTGRVLIACDHPAVEIVRNIFGPRLLLVQSAADLPSALDAAVSVANVGLN